VSPCEVAHRVRVADIGFDREYGVGYCG